MRRLSFVAVLSISTALVFVACKREDTEAPAEPAVSEPEPEVEPEPEPEPEPEQDPEEIKVDQDVVSRDGFEARDLHCVIDVPTRGATGYILAGLTDADAALDACAPKGAAIKVEWSYVNNVAGNASVSASSQKMANCVAKAMGEVHAGVSAKCSAVLLLGDLTAATAAYDAR